MPARWLSRAAASVIPAAVGAVLTGFGALPARAQLLNQYISPDVPGIFNEPGVTVTSRTRPDYQSSGVTVGAFTIRPVLNEGAGFETNVLGTTVPHGSPIIETNPTVNLDSNWSRNSLHASLSADNIQYTRLSTQSYTNWSASIGGTYEIGRDALSVSYSHLNLNQTLLDLNVPQLNQPLAYRIDAGRLEYRFNFARSFVTPSVELSHYAFDNGTAQNGFLQQDFRDRIVVSPGLTAGYQLAPERNLVVVLRDSLANYARGPVGMPRENFNDLSILGGIDYQTDGPIRYRALAGYEVRQFQSSVYKTIQAPVVEGSIIWTPTGLTTLTGTVSRRIEDSSDDTTTGYTESAVLLRVDHEYLRNVLLRGTLGFYDDDYNGGSNQTLVQAGAGGSYLLNRNMQLDLGYNFSARQSGSTTATTTPAPTNQSLGSSYTDHRIILQLRLAL